MRLFCVSPVHYIISLFLDEGEYYTWCIIMNPYAGIITSERYLVKFIVEGARTQGAVGSGSFCVIKYDWE